MYCVDHKLVLMKTNYTQKKGIDFIIFNISPTQAQKIHYGGV